jgi:hypothetical protein
MLRAVVDLHIAEHLARGPLTAAEVAAREGSAVDSTFRLMRAAVMVGLLTVDDDNRFHSTAMLDTLRADHPLSQRAFVSALTGPGHWLPWNSFTTTVRTGQSQVKATFGMDLFEYFDQHPVEQQEFSAAMSSYTKRFADAVAPAIDTAKIKLAVDIGGANGTLLHTLQESNPELRGIVFDRPTVAVAAEAQLAGTKFAGRTEVVGGDFFEAVPAGDLYLLKHILHDWHDDACVTILRRCREAMMPGGRVAIIEQLIGELHDPGASTIMDLAMLALSEGGRERSVAEFDTLLRAAGLQRTSVVTTDSPLAVIEAVAA